ncbi:hypothetical protein C8R46DRAFT_1283775 [Mycena filopes]|nr:hypothetical protein C8R46DRAFT_1283775 [Mycena filopes]
MSISGHQHLALLTTTKARLAFVEPIPGKVTGDSAHSVTFLVDLEHYSKLQMPQAELWVHGTGTRQHPRLFYARLYQVTADHRFKIAHRPSLFSLMRLIASRMLPSRPRSWKLVVRLGSVDEEDTVLDNEWIEQQAGPKMGSESTQGCPRPSKVPQASRRLREIINFIRWFRGAREASRGLGFPRTALDGLQAPNQGTPKRIAPMMNRHELTVDDNPDGHCVEVEGGLQGTQRKRG